MFATSKTFVDMQMRRKETLISDSFRTLNNTYNGNIPLPKLKQFVQTNFKFHSLKKWIPPDFKNHPKILDYVQDHNYK